MTKDELDLWRKEAKEKLNQAKKDDSFEDTYREWLKK